MDPKDWYDYGAKVGDLVQSAIDKKDFKRLNQSITEALSEAAASLQKSGWVRTEKMAGRPVTWRASGNAYEQAMSQANVSDLLSRSSTRRGIFTMVAGYGMAVVNALLALGMFLTGGIAHMFGFVLTGVIFLVLAAVFASVGAKGANYRGRLTQLKKYLQIMGDRDTVTIKELSHGTGRTPKEVRQDLKAMIREGMFASEAYLDEQLTTLMTSREAYSQYQETVQAYQKRKAEKEQREREKARGSGADASSGAEYSEETAKILKEGREFIRHIHEANEVIQDEEMSAKLERLELVVSRIFAQVAKEPESAPDLHRMMSYYLPVTRKLVDAYVDLGEEKIGGENIARTREEIERSLDTVNGAFETFLDSFYQETAWDISSDISAMKAMMARDGLTGQDDFQRVRTVAGDMEQTGEDGSAAQAGTGGGGFSAGNGYGSAAAAVEEEK